MHQEYEFNYKWIRLFYICGEGQGEKSILSLLDKAIQNNEVINKPLENIIVPI